MRPSLGKLGFNMQLGGRESGDVSRGQIEIHRKAGTQSGSHRRKLRILDLRALSLWAARDYP
jgi:hypothetical protein